MALSISLLRSSAGARSTLCRRCLNPRLAGSTSQQIRSISMRVQEKRKAADEAWAARAAQIDAGEVKNLWDIFKERGFVKDLAGTDEQIAALMKKKRIGAYVGIDPTAPSLHVGHLLPLMALFWMYMHGYGANSLIGGATVRVGDPTGRLQDRDEMTSTNVTVNIAKIHYQLQRVWRNVDHLSTRFGHKKEWSSSRALLNNSTWFHSTSFMEVVQRLFSGMRMGPLLSRDNVKRRLEGDGMPLDEFIYPLLQAWDWWHMFSSPRQVLMQIGGSDQYGNIVTGIEAVKHLRDTEPDPVKRMPNDLLHTPVGFTVPLLTDSSGAKFGKSAGNAVWLDPFMTSSFDLYGYFMRRPDADVEKLLRLLTFLPMDAIKSTMERQAADPGKRIAHHTLAYEIVSLVHSPQLAQETQEEHKSRYSKNSSGGQQAQIELSEYPSEGPATSQRAVAFKHDIELPESLIKTKSIGRILYAAGLAASSTEGHKLTTHGGAYIGGAPEANKGMVAMHVGALTFVPVKTWFPEENHKFLIGGELMILRRGKHFVRIIKVVSDEEWKRSGQSYPGEAGTGRVRKLMDLMSKQEVTGPEGEKTKKQLSISPRDAAEFVLNMQHLEKLEDPENPRDEVIFPHYSPPSSDYTEAEAKAAALQRAWTDLKIQEQQERSQKPRSRQQQNDRHDKHDGSKKNWGGEWKW
ncbi:tyrosyl-tRNA synthetase [Apiospora saccharicola]|uniref:Tyrosine--tRNA ligase n=1 Tax=Apiospora saccharicola TaxID=335842 RepID=A0ABR1VPE4_9PEZI